MDKERKIKSYTRWKKQILNLVYPSFHENREVAVIGQTSLTIEFAKHIESKCKKVYLWSKNNEYINSYKSIEFHNYSIENKLYQSYLLREASYVFIFGCYAQVFKQVLDLAKPYCCIVIVGNILDELGDIDFYATVHKKNLIVTGCNLDIISSKEMDLYIK